MSTEPSHFPVPSSLLSRAWAPKPCTSLQSVPSYCNAWTPRSSLNYFRAVQKQDKDHPRVHRHFSCSRPGMFLDSL
jgi:hypothetical protein